MFEILQDRWNSMFGRANAQPSRRAPRGLDRAGPSNEEGALLEIFHLGVRCFHEGSRRQAIPLFEQVLAHRLRVPTFRLTSAALLAETYRGLGAFVRAEQFYKLSIGESEAVPRQERSGNEWFEHYRPRAHLGLLMTLRRTLSKDHDQIRSLLSNSRDEFARYPAPDLMAQLNVVEGLYYRQLGDFAGANDRLLAGAEAVRDLVVPYFLFLNPEHIECLLLLSCLCTPSETPRASRIARQELRSERSPWSAAVAAAGMLHLKLRRNDMGSISDAEGLLDRLEKNAAFEADPFLLTEGIMLRIACAVACQRLSTVPRELGELAASLKADVPPPILVLRAVELGSLAAPLSDAGCLDADAKGLLAEGRSVLERLSSRLESYGCGPKIQQQWKAVMNLHNLDRPFWELWNSDAVWALRARVWP